MNNLHERILINDCFEVIREIETESEINQISDKNIKGAFKTATKRIKDYLIVFKLKNNL